MGAPSFLLMEHFLFLVFFTVIYAWTDATDYPNEGEWRYASNYQKVSYGTYNTNSKSTNCGYITTASHGPLVALRCSFDDDAYKFKTLCQISIY